MRKIENTVAADNQVKGSDKVSFFGNENAKTRVLIVGNSITRHGPKAEIGWMHDHGMAASAPEKDYVHRLFAMLKESGKDVYMRVRHASDWERGFVKGDCLPEYQGDRDFQADVVVFRLGENVAQADYPFFEKAVREFIEYICPAQSKVLFTTTFWSNGFMQRVLQAYANERGDVCVNCSFDGDEKNMALGLFEHKGVAAHPSDAGMEEIAKAIFNTLVELV